MGGKQLSFFSPYGSLSLDTYIQITSSLPFSRPSLLPPSPHPLSPSCFFLSLLECSFSSLGRSSEHCRGQGRRKEPEMGALGCCSPSLHPSASPPRWGRHLHLFHLTLQWCCFPQDCSPPVFVRLVTTGSAVWEPCSPVEYWSHWPSSATGLALKVILTRGLQPEAWASLDSLRGRTFLYTRIYLRDWIIAGWCIVVAGL